MTETEISANGGRNALVKNQRLNALIANHSAQSRTFVQDAVSAPRTFTLAHHHGRTHESTKSIPRTNVLKGLYRCRSSHDWRQVHQPCYARQMELLYCGLGNAGGNVIGLFLVLCLGAAIAIVVGWLFVQIILWMEE